MIKWEKGPLGFPASPDWCYWCPTIPDGKHRAWHQPNGLPGPKDILLGDNLQTLEEAQQLCEAHLKEKRTISWIKGPLGFQASKDWRYWCPQNTNDTWYAKYMPTGLPGPNDQELGDNLQTLEEAQQLCEKHLTDNNLAIGEEVTFDLSCPELYVFSILGIK